MKKRKIFLEAAVVIAVVLALIMPGSAIITNVENTNSEKLDLKAMISPTSATPAICKEPARLEMKKLSPRPMTIGTNTLITSQNPNIDQNPAIVADEEGGLLSMYEIEIEELEFDIGMSNSLSGGSEWSEQYFFEVDGYGEQPRLDYYEGKTAYGTFTADPYEGFGFGYFTLFPEITDPEAGELGWVYYSVEWGTNEIGVPFTSCDVACYPTENPPTSYWWGIVGYTGDQRVQQGGEDYSEDDTFMFQFAADEEGYVRIIFFYNMDFDVSNIATDIDRSNSQLYLVADYVNETDPEGYGLYLLTHGISSSEDWWRGSWPGVLFFHCDYPQIDANGGRVYLVAELVNEDDSRDIVCWTTDDPEDFEAWEGYLVTETPGEDELNPVVTAASDTGATVVFTKDNNLYLARTTDSGQTWSNPQQINDQSGTVVEQYGCADIQGAYTVWTDDREENTDVYFDTIGNQPNKPDRPSGPKKGKAGVEHTYTTSATDPDEDQLYYWFEWGDGTNSGWVGLYNSGQTASAKHKWTEEGDYQIKVKAKDTSGIVSDWSDPLSVSMPKNKAINTPFIRFLENHPHLFPILRYFLGL